MTQTDYTAPAHPRPTVAYLVTIFGMTLIGVIAVITVFAFRPDKDNSTLIVAILGFVAPTTAALLAFLKAQETHVIVNSRMDEFKRELQNAALLQATTARAEGVAAGREAGREAADIRTDELLSKTLPPVDVGKTTLTGELSNATLTGELSKATLGKKSK